MLTTKTNEIEKRIVVFNQLMIESSINEIPIGLFYGRMGLCIYFYHQYRYYQKAEYKQFAETLLDSVCDSVDKETPVDFESGLAGVCWGILYLIEQKFIEGKPNYILKEYDEKILREFPLKYLDSESTNIKSLLRILFYFSKRLEDQWLSSDERFLFESYIIKGINLIDGVPSHEKLTEVPFFSYFDYTLPLYLELLYRVYQQHFYNYKIDKIFDSLSSLIRSTCPLSGSNRVYLYCQMEKIAKLRKLNYWDEHIAVLRQTVEVEKIVREEFRNKNILLGNGLAGFYYLLRQFDLLSEESRALVLEKLIDSEYWQIMKRPDELRWTSGLLNGASGIILMSQDIMKNKR